MNSQQLTEALADISAAVERHFGKGTEAVLVICENNNVSVLYPKGTDPVAVLAQGYIHESGAAGPAALVVKAKPKKGH